MQAWNMAKKANNNGNNNGNEKSGSDTDSKELITVSGNHVYFYCDVNPETTLTLNKTLRELSGKLIQTSLSMGFDSPVIHLHISSYGGYVDGAMAIMDTMNIIQSGSVKIHTFVEGVAASAATFISLAGHKRYITKSSRMMIHQLSAGMFGSYWELRDAQQNFDNLMILLKNIYLEKTSVPEKEIDEILSHDIYWSAEQCLKYDLVDEII